MPGKRAAAALLGSLMLSLSACSTASQLAPEDCTPTDLNLHEDNVLKVVGPDYPPLTWVEGGNLEGVDGEILTGFAEEHCLSVEVSVLPQASVIEAMRGGQADVVTGGWYRTEERAEVVNQTSPVYVDPALIVGKDPTASLEDYADAQIGTTQGYLWSDDLQNWGGSGVSLYQSPDAVFQDLLNGRIDVALMAAAEASFRLEENPESGLTSVDVDPFDEVPATLYPAETNFPHTLDNDRLLEALDEYIEEIRDEGRLSEILEEHGLDAEFADPEEYVEQQEAQAEEG